MAELLVEDVTIRYDMDGSGGVVACENVNFGVESGEFIVIVGRSGCGKTSLLYAIDGLVPLAGGRIAVAGNAVSGPGRDRAMVFQSPSLFPWRSVLANVKFGAEAVQDRGELDAKAHALIKLVGLEGFERRHPHQLSGGMQQRVNLARALAVDPNVLLLDEPFSALDAQTRELLQSELLRIWEQRNAGGRHLTMVFVTHDISEAVYLADRVIVFSSRPGRVQTDIEIDLSRPRDPKIKRSTEFQAYVEQIAELLEGAG